MTPSATPDADAPYAGLNPDTVLDALDAVGLRGDGRLIQLNSYENRVFQVFLEDGRVVVAKFYRPARWTNDQILEEHAFAAELAAADIPVAACWPLVLNARSMHADRISLIGSTLGQFDTPLGSQRFSVSPRLAGRAPELEDAGTLEWIGRFVGRMHAVGQRRPFECRQTLDLATFGTANREWLVANDIVPPDAALPWQAITAQALDAIAEAFARGGAPKLIRLHGDCHLGNVLWTPAGPHFVDLDDAVTGPAVQDLWMLLSGDRAAMTRQLGAVLSGYESFMDFNVRELRLIEALRTLRMLHHSAWIAQRWNDPAFPTAFPWFGTSSYWAQQTTQFAEQIEAMHEAPLRFN